MISVPSPLTEELLLLAAVAESNLKNSGSKGEEEAADAEREGEAIRLSRGKEPFVLILERWWHLRKRFCKPNFDFISGFSFRAVGEAAKSYRNPSIAKDSHNDTRKMVNAGQFEVKFGLSVHFIMRGDKARFIGAENALKCEWNLI